MVNFPYPFTILPSTLQSSLKDQFKAEEYKKSRRLYLQNQSTIDGFDLIVEGGYEGYFYDRNQQKRRLENYGPGTWFGGISILYNKGISLQTVDILPGTKILRLSKEAFWQICTEHADFKDHFIREFGERMLDEEFVHFIKGATYYPQQSNLTSDSFYTQQVGSLNPREIISCHISTPIREAAKLMAEEKTSCIFISGQGQDIVGYVTDITLRDQVIAKSVNPEAPIEVIMKKDIVYIDAEAYIYEALLLMFQTKTRYLLVKAEGDFIGFISRNKLLSEQSQSPFLFIQSVKQATTVAELKDKWAQVPAIVEQLLHRGVKSETVNQVITTVSDTIALRVIDKVIHDIGPAPSKFVFITLGSEGRKEQTLKTDQDNAIIYEDKANEQRELVRSYFLEFAEQVSDHLNTIGFSFCKGGFMAKNPKWTHSLSHWKRNYDEWMMESTQETVMKYSTFFDNRAIYGDVSILEELHTYMRSQLEEPLERFFFNMATNSLQYEPPLTFFKGIRTFTMGEQKVFDIKKAMTPIVDITRVFALKHQIFLTNTGERLEALAAQNYVTEEELQELKQAYYYLMGLRLDRQAQQIMLDKEEPRNFINMSSLTKIEKVTLIEIFKVIKNFQMKVKIAFTNTIF
ncbi:nucleotidyltransferase family protein [Echinicola pacifica]|uniref:Nucleotidyltransferase family protein n=1 Tax=Echinicola pacifica TaxID=346377 RepID=A0A918UR26_9BACT|nr:DUF294 nucleotidyltransferase-like domain-containing protein [Echinicola pacifica]GGZ27602.1 nucleotidyltransferase family protein [Echinicola pacifica]